MLVLGLAELGPDHGAIVELIIPLDLGLELGSGVPKGLGLGLGVPNLMVTDGIKRRIRKSECEEHFSIRSEYAHHCKCATANTALQTHHSTGRRTTAHCL